MSDTERNVLAGGVCLAIFGGIIFVIGLQEGFLSQRASRVPEEIALKDLIARGASGNPNIILKDFVPGRNYVYRSKGGSWTNAWVPVVPAGTLAPGQNPTTVQALIFSINARNEADLYGRCGQGRLPALVTNGLVSLGSEEKNLLQQTYPGTDFSRCLIIQEGRAPAGTLKQILMIGGGLVAFLVGLGMSAVMGWKWYQNREVATIRKKKRPQRERDDEDDEEDLPPRRRRSYDEDDDPPRRPRRSRRDD